MVSNSLNPDPILALYEPLINESLSQRIPTIKASPIIQV